MNTNIARIDYSKIIMILCLAFAVLAAGMNLSATLLPNARPPLPKTNERYSPELVVIDSLDKAEIYIRARLRRGATESEIADAIESFVSHRFVHDVGKIQRGSDWVAWLVGSVIWDNLSFTTRPNDMLKTRRGICSQQAMLMQALLARFGIEYSTVGFSFPAHMFVGAKIDGRWAVYDPNGEPSRNRTIYYSEMGDPSVMRSLYQGKPANPRFERSSDLGEQFAHGSRMGAYEMKWVNENPAPQATIFHHATSLLSRFGWAISLFVAFLMFVLRLRIAPVRQKSTDDDHSGCDNSVPQSA